jgi:hypothetical protein
VFEPETRTRLRYAKLGLIDRNDPMTSTVAKLIIGLAQDGERDRKKLCDRAVKILRMTCADDVRQAVANKIIVLAKADERNPDRLCEEGSEGYSPTPQGDRFRSRVVLRYQVTPPDPAHGHASLRSYHVM